MPSKFQKSLCLLSAVAASSFNAPLSAQGRETVQNYNIRSQSLAEALKTVAREAGYEIIFSADEIGKRRVDSVKGRFDIRTAISRLLEGSGLVSEFSGRTIVIRREESANRADDAAVATTPIIVTGSRIRGAQESSPVIRITGKNMRNGGQNDLGEVVRNLPQNYNGGQNPGIGIGAESFGSQNGNSATALNLRGLGPDATLTLLNGRRLVYDSAYQGVDISTIPIAAVDRVEIVADGASAIYGSDAVGGVANIILKRDHQGIDLKARVGAPTDGGNFQQQYSAVGGTRWSSGGFIATLDLNRAGSITAGQRSYTRQLHPTATLYPRQDYRGVVLSGHQAITDNLTFEIDALYGKRRSNSETPFTTVAPANVNGNTVNTSAKTFLASPRLSFETGAWNIAANAIYGTSQSVIDTRFYTAGVSSPASVTQYDNRSNVYELNAEGPLFTLPGGDARLAIGGGYRAARLRSLRSGRTTKDTLNSHYAFGEIFVPLVSPEMDFDGIYRLTLNAAARYENYPSMAEVTTPKLGLVYAPIAGLDLKLSWGRSFKAPTLNQQLLAQTVLLFPASLLGGNGLPTTATALIVAGGNVALEPERAKTLAFGFEARPIDGLRLEFNWFDIKYKDRVVQPIPSLGTSLSNPAVADLIDFTPTPAEQADFIANAFSALLNLTGRPYDPAQVIAIIDSRFRNVASQSVNGIDIAASYQVPTGAGANLTLSASASHLNSKRRLSPKQPQTVLAGNIFNPPSWRARGGISWERDDFSLSSFVNYIGPVRDTRFQPVARIDGMTSIDVVSRYQTAAQGFLGGVEFQISILNLFNAKPANIRTTQPYNTPYDSTNYSPLGRVIGVSIGKAW